MKRLSAPLTCSCAAFLLVCREIWSSHSLCDRLIWPCTTEPTGLLPKAARHHTWGRNVAGLTFKLIIYVTVYLSWFLPKGKWGKVSPEPVVIQCLPQWHFNILKDSPQQNDLRLHAAAPNEWPRSGQQSDFCQVLLEKLLKPLTFAKALLQWG